MHRSLRVAAAQPLVSDDLAATVAAHAGIVEAAHADLIVFPELSLTGYHLDAPAIALDDSALLPLIGACSAAGSVALVGAPVAAGGVRSIAMLAFDTNGVRVAYRKRHLGGEESAHFTAIPGPSTTEVRGWRVGLAICKDTGVAAHTESLAATGIDLYACGVVHHADEIDEQERRAATISATCAAPVLMASFAGPTGHGYTRTAGHSAIWSSTSTLIARASGEPDDFVVTVLPGSDH